MKIKKIILLLISCIILVLLSLWGISEVKEANLKKLHSKMTYSSEEIYQLIDDSPTFLVEKTFFDENWHCLYQYGRNFIMTQVTYENNSYVICIATFNNWEEAWDIAQHWNKHAIQTNWAFGMIMFSYGDVLVQINPIDEAFLEEFNSLIIDSSNQ